MTPEGFLNVPFIIENQIVNRFIFIYIFIARIRIQISQRPPLDVFFDFSDRFFFLVLFEFIRQRPDPFAVLYKFKFIHADKDLSAFRNFNDNFLLFFFGYFVRHKTGKKKFFAFFIFAVFVPEPGSGQVTHKFALNFEG